MGDEKNPYVAHSRFIKEKVIVSSVEDVIGVLRTYAKKLHEKAVVIACSDGASSLLDVYYNELTVHFFLPGSNGQGMLTKIMDKEEMSELGRSVGFHVPESWIVEKEEDIDNIVYPCITKPILSKDGLKSDIQICYKKSDLLEVVRTGNCYKYQVQKFIDKDFEYQLIGLSLNGGKELIIPGISRCIRPCPGTNTGFLKYTRIDSFSVPIEKCRQFVRQTTYSGLFSIEFLRDKSGNDYFMEMNFRNDGNSICVTKAGYNLPYLWYAYNSKLDYRSILDNYCFREVLVMPELDDFNRFVRTRKVGLLQWLNDVKKTDAFMEYDSKDSVPFWIALRQYVIRGVKKSPYV